MTDFSSMPVKVGDILDGKYRVERYLGAGTMGFVVAALHLKLDQLQAIKLIKPAYAEAPRALERFTNEARAAARLHHEHAVAIYDFGQFGSGMPYLVMEYLEGSDLYTHIENQGREPFPIDLAVLYMVQVCSALAKAHAAGIIHRDLKPANLFVTTKSNGAPCIKVLDFGISKLDPMNTVSWAPLTQTSDVLGTPYYMSPEQMDSTRDVDARTDLWSLGVILYELITGRRPFEGPVLAQVITAVNQKPPKRPSSLRKDLPPDLESIILRCLEKDPKQRIASVRDLKKQLQPYAMEDLPAARGRGSSRSL